MSDSDFDLTDDDLDALSDVESMAVPTPQPVFTVGDENGDDGALTDDERAALDEVDSGADFERFVHEEPPVPSQFIVGDSEDSGDGPLTDDERAALDEIDSGVDFERYVQEEPPVPPQFIVSGEPEALDESDLAVLDEVDGWQEIVGANEVGPQTPGFEEELARRAAAASPIEAEVAAGKKLVQWDLPFGPVSAPAGKRTTITVNPQCLFRGEKILATDSGSPAGTVTRILSVVVGQKVQRPAGGGGTLTMFFAQTALANGIRFDTAHRWNQIAVTVSFIQDATFDMTIFGSAIVDDD